MAEMGNIPMLMTHELSHHLTAQQCCVITELIVWGLEIRRMDQITMSSLNLGLIMLNDRLWLMWDVRVFLVFTFLHCIIKCQVRYITAVRQIWVTIIIWKSETGNYDNSDMAWTKRCPRQQTIKCHSTKTLNPRQSPCSTLSPKTKRNS